MWNFSKEIIVAKSSSITPNKFTYKAISVFFPRVNLFWNLEERKNTVLPFLKVFLVGKQFNITNKTAEYLCVWMRLCKNG